MLIKCYFAKYISCCCFIEKENGTIEIVANYSIQTTLPMIQQFNIDFYASVRHTDTPICSSNLVTFRQALHDFMDLCSFHPR